MNAVPAPLESPSPEHADEMHRLRRLLEGSSGGFALIIAGYNRPLYRDQLIKILASSDSLNGFAVLDVSRFHELNELENDLEHQEGQQTGPLHLIGLDDWLAHDKDRPQGLERIRGINRHRDYIAKLCRRPLVLWLLEHQIGEFAREAPDAWEWRAGVVNFAVHNQTETIELPELPHVFTGNWEERQARIVELREFLTSHNHQSSEPKQASIAWDELGALLADNRDWAAASAAYEQVRLACEQMDYRQGSALALGKIAFINWQRGDLELALSQARTALGIFEDLGHLRAQASTIALIASILLGCNELEDALHIRQNNELPIYERLGDVHSQAVTLGEIAEILLMMGDISTARIIIEQALKLGSPSDSDTVRNINRLGDVLQAQGDWAKARVAFERALAISEEAFGPNHPDVAVSANNLGIVLLEMGDFIEAQKAFQRALTICLKTDGPEHPRVALSVGNLGNVTELLGDYAKAHIYYKQALSILERTFGADHPHVLMLRRNLNNLTTLLSLSTYS